MCTTTYFLVFYYKIINISSCFTTDKIFLCVLLQNISLCLTVLYSPQAFKIFDVDGDGEIDSAELISILTQVLHVQVLYLRLPSSRSSALFLTSSSHQVGDPLSQAEAEELVREADFNGDGKINYIEFVAMTVRP